MPNSPLSAVTAPAFLPDGSLTDVFKIFGVLQPPSPLILKLAKALAIGPRTNLLAGMIFPRNKLTFTDWTLHRLSTIAYNRFLVKGIC